LANGDDPPPDARADIQFISDIIDTLVNRWCLDPNRVYATGYSGVDGCHRPRYASWTASPRSPQWLVCDSVHRMNMTPADRSRARALPTTVPTPGRDQRMTSVNPSATRCPPTPPCGASSNNTRAA